MKKISPEYIEELYDNAHGHRQTTTFAECHCEGDTITLEGVPSGGQYEDEYVTIELQVDSVEVEE